MKNVTKRIFTAVLTLTVVAACVVTTSPQATAKKRERSDITIGIDPGHQSRGNFGTEPMGPGSSVKKTKVAGGTHGTTSGVPEYKLTLAVGKYLKKELKARGYKVVMTRSRNDVDISNKERAEKLNKKCNIAIRLHADGAAPSAKGATALYPSLENPFLSRSVCKKSKKLSQVLLDSYCRGTSLKKRGLSARDDLTGTNWSKIPVTLIEMGFMTNESDDTYMAKAKNRKKMAKALADGIDAYYGFHK